MTRLILAVRAALGSLRSSTAATARSAAMRARRLGTYSEPDDVALVAVPGTSRNVPLYLLAPGTTFGLVALVVRTVLVFVATLTTVAWFWVAVAVGTGKADASVRDSLVVLSVFLWLAALLAAEWSWASRPRHRPLSSDVDRW